jgi:hypothetical protein
VKGRDLDIKKGKKGVLQPKIGVVKHQTWGKPAEHRVSKRTAHVLFPVIYWIDPNYTGF